MFWFMVLLGSTYVLLKTLVRITASLVFTEFIVAFILMGVIFSLPQLSVGVYSALEQSTSLALGSVIGSNIVDLTLIIGVIVLLTRGIKVESEEIISNAAYMYALVILPMALMLIDLPLTGKATLSQFDGCILILAFFLYVLKQMRVTKEYVREFVCDVSTTEFITNVIVVLLGLPLLFISAYFVVDHGVLLSAELLLPLMLIGLFMVSFGTSLPKLNIESRLVLTGHKEMALAGLIGSVVTNSTLVLGLTALIYPIQPAGSDFFLFLTSGFFMLIAAFLFLMFIDSEKSISWQEALSLIFLYISFVIVEFIIESLQHSALYLRI
ncbi:MAG: hypothetical protein U9Q22_04530 [Candidatus Altiarchaeota archaeon]|nr:hypothetical protein [Candidatus Altiarchaeota archaeon]